jgi:hypothetical protein
MRYCARQAKHGSAQRYVYNLVGKPDATRPLERTICSRKDNIKIAITEIGCA